MSDHHGPWPWCDGGGIDILVWNSYPWGQSNSIGSAGFSPPPVLNSAGIETDEAGRR